MADVRTVSLLFVWLGLAVMLHVSTGIPANSVHRLQETVKTARTNTINEQLMKAAIEKKYDMSIIKQYTAKFKNIFSEIRRDEFHVKHPINAYRFVRNTTVMVPNTFMRLREELLDPESKDKTIFDIQQDNIKKFPGKRDLKVIMNNLVNLQDRYDLSVKDLVQGPIHGYESAKLSIAECLEVAIHLYQDKEYHYGRKWLDHARFALDHDDDGSVEKKDLYKKATRAAFRSKSYKEALELATVLRDLNETSHHYIALHNMTKERVKKFDAEETAEKKQFLTELADGLEKYKTGFDFLRDAMCQGESVKDPGVAETRLCHVTDQGNPFLKIQPIKMEEISRDPFILVMHDVITRQEIKSLKKAATGEITMLNDISFVEFGKANSSYQRAIIPQQKMTNLKSRIELLTGLGLKTGEPFQVANFGPGGFQQVHHDTEDDESRYATFVAFLSDVEAGGALSFVNIRETIFPSAGNAVFWFNKYRNGAVQPQVRHEVCPILVGDMWTLTAWPHDDDQTMFL